MVRQAWCICICHDLLKVSLGPRRRSPPCPQPGFSAAGPFPSRGPAASCRSSRATGAGAGGAAAPGLAKPRGGNIFDEANNLNAVGHTMKNLFTSAIAASCLVAFVPVAQARSAYDGSWDLRFVTQRGPCDPTYDFSVNVADGVVTHPNLMKFRGNVARSGAVRASVAVPNKYASGSGRLSGNSGRGTWSGYSGGARCSGYWTAQRN